MTGPGYASIRAHSAHKSKVRRLSRPPMTPLSGIRTEASAMAGWPLTGMRTLIQTVRTGDGQLGRGEA